MAGKSVTQQDRDKMAGKSVTQQDRDTVGRQKCDTRQGQDDRQKCDTTRQGHSGQAKV